MKIVILFIKLVILVQAMRYTPIIIYWCLFISFQIRCMQLYWNGEAYNPLIMIIASIATPISFMYILYTNQDKVRHTSTQAPISVHAPKMTLIRWGVILCIVLVMYMMTWSMRQQEFVLQHSWWNPIDITLHRSYIYALFMQGLGLWGLLWLLYQWKYAPYVEMVEASVFSSKRIDSHADAQANLKSSHLAHKPIATYSMIYPLGLFLFALPWEILLQNYSVFLQALGTDLAIYGLDIADLVFDLQLDLYYWNRYTFYSDRFYLLINQS